MTLTKVTLLLASTSAPCPKKLSPENTESSMATFESLMTMVAPGSSTAFTYSTPAYALHLRALSGLS